MDFGQEEDSEFAWDLYHKYEDREEAKILSGLILADGIPTGLASPVPAEKRRRRQGPKV